ncbi:MAG: 4-alpha-glucanotransferase [Clostridia bacterium]|nr:4-alpha-glucanotransferase [Clostridia bacterium]
MEKIKRGAGLLLNVSSMPGRYGIGGFSKETELVLNEIKSLGFKIWQTLPITSLGWGNSPYSGISTYAGNFLYLEPERMFNLLSPEECNSFEYHGEIYLTDYAFAFESKRRMIKLAYSRINDEIKEKMDKFVQENKWVLDYAVFMTLKEKFNQAGWSTWGKYAKHSTKIVNEVLNEYKEETGYYIFEQLCFYTQWKEIKEYANNLGIQVFGDLPIYVSCDSVDVWANPDQFMLDKDFKPTEVAGVPPDYFAKDGQLWGNPLYNYEHMAKNNYKWWIDRICHTLDLYDIVRIDHFRGLCQYWAVKATEKTAKNGVWKDGPKMALFDELKKVRPDAQIIAEDLGIIDKSVEDFLEETGFKGMRVMQFGFDGDPLNKHLPHNHDKNCVAYSATHDNNTTLGWLLSLDVQTLNDVLHYISCDNSYGWADGAGRCRATKAFIKSIMQSSADIAIFPMQDLCGYGTDTRMNTPGQADGCWRYRTNFNAINQIDYQYIQDLIRTYGRL